MSNSVLIHLLFSYYHYDDNYYPGDQDISAEIQSMKRALLKRDVSKLFQAINAHASLLRSKANLTKDEIDIFRRNIDMAFERAAEKQDLGYSRILFSTNSGIAVLRSLGIKSNYLDVDVTEYRLNDYVVCHNQSASSKVQHLTMERIKALYSKSKEIGSGPSLLYGLAFSANHCYVTTHDYRAAIRHCDIALDLINRGTAGHVYPFMFANDFRDIVGQEHASCDRRPFNIRPMSRIS